MTPWVKQLPPSLMLTVIPKDQVPHTNTYTKQVRKWLKPLCMKVEMGPFGERKETGKRGRKGQWPWTWYVQMRMSL